MSAFDVFLSYNWRDHDQVEGLALRLRGAGINVFLDRWYLAPGANWLRALEGTLDSCKAVVVCIGAEMGAWQLREQYSALARQADEERSGRVFPVIPVLLPGSEPPLGFLRQNSWIDLRSRPDNSVGLGILAKAIRGEPAGPDALAAFQTTLARVCPYRGLLYFREEDAEFFFGREDGTRQLQAAVDTHSLVALVGASGCGKSSVVRAGLIPALRKSKAPVWEIATIVPGERPLHALASALVPMLEPQMSEVERLSQINLLVQQFGDGAIALRDVVDRVCAKQPGTDRLMLVVDQWEELFTLTSDQAIRRRFIDSILESTEKAKLSVVITLRGDFFGRAVTTYRALCDRVQGAQINLGPMNQTELRRAIEEPAIGVGLNFEAGLVDTILADAADEPGNLPLVEFVLRQLWEERQGSRMHRAAYLAMGRLTGAIAQKADAVYGALRSPEQLTLQRIFTRLVHPGEGEHDTRRRATSAEFGSDAAGLIKKLSDERLLVTSRTTGDIETVEVAHEALIRNWHLLRGWVDADRQFIAWQQDVHENATKWQANKRSADLLLRGGPLRRAREWQANKRDALSVLEAAFIAASVRRKYLRISIYILAPVLVVALFVGAFYDEMERLFNAIGNITLSTLPSDEESREIELSDSYDKIGNAKVSADRLGEAQKSYEDGTEIRERVALAHPYNTDLQRALSRSYSALGDVNLAMDRLDAARKYYKQSQAICEHEAKAHPTEKQSVFGFWPDDLRRSYMKLGDVELAARQFDAARMNYGRAQEIVEGLAKADPRRGAGEVNLQDIDEKLGDVELSAGRLDQAREKYGQGRDIAERLAKGDPEASILRFSLSESYMKLGDVELAARQFDVARMNYGRAQKIIEGIANSDAIWVRDQKERDLRNIHNKLGDVQLAIGRLDAAGKEYRQGLDIGEHIAKRSQTLGSTRRDLADSYMKIGDVLARQNHSAQALQYFRMALAIRTSLADGDPTNTIWKKYLSELQIRISELEARGNRRQLDLPANREMR